MQRMAWTDERLEERFDSIDRRFDDVDRRLDRVEGAIVTLGHEVRSELRELQTTLNRAGMGIIIGLVGVIAAVLTSGT